MTEKNILGHIKDIKAILIRVIIAFLIVFGVLFYFSGGIFEFLLKLFDFDKIKLIFSSLEGGITAKMLIAFNFAVVILMPYFALELIIYLKSAFLSRHKFTLLFLFAFLFYFLGVLGAMLWLIPIFIKFLLSIGFLGVDFYIDASVFISFVVKTVVVFGFVFETPIILILLLKMRVISLEFLKKQRRKVVVLSFVLGAILTPPDILSQIVVALVIYSFFEVVILYQTLISKKKSNFVKKYLR